MVGFEHFNGHLMSTPTSTHTLVECHTMVHLEHKLKHSIAITWYKKLEVNLQGFGYSHWWKSFDDYHPNALPLTEMDQKAEQFSGDAAGRTTGTRTPQPLTQLPSLTALEV